MPQFLILPPWYLVLYKKKKSKDRGGAGDMAQGVRPRFNFPAPTQWFTTLHSSSWVTQATGAHTYLQAKHLHIKWRLHADTAGCCLRAVCEPFN